MTVFELITGGALQKIGEFDNQAEASAAAGISGKLQKNGFMQYSAVRNQLKNPSKKPSKATASSSGGSYYFIYTFQLEDAITDVDIKAKLALRGTAAARKELKDWRRSQAGTWSCRTRIQQSTAQICKAQAARCASPCGALSGSLANFVPSENWWPDF